MKKYFLILTLLTASAITTYGAMWRVNNSSGVARNFATIQEAVDSAAVGDTIHIEGSITTYNEVVKISKRLNLFGTGFYLSDNLPPTQHTQHVKQSAKVTTIRFENGSAGSILSGVEQIVATGYEIEIADSAIQIRNCKLYRVVIDNTSKPLANIDIRRSWIDGRTAAATYVLGAGIVTKAGGTHEVLNLTIGNNFISGTDAINLHINTRASISFNTFYDRFGVTSMHTGTKLSNNVFFRVGTAAMTLSLHGADNADRNLFNIASPWGFLQDNINNNRFNSQPETEWFTRIGGSAMVDKFFNAPFNSPIVTTALGEDQLGMFGGLIPYNLSGMATIPSVYEIIMPNEVSAEGFDVTVKVRAH